MGMLATVINTLAFQDALEHRECPQGSTAIEMRSIAGRISGKALRHMERQGGGICVRNRKSLPQPIPQRPLGCGNGCGCHFACQGGRRI